MIPDVVAQEPAGEPPSGGPHATHRALRGATLLLVRQGLVSALTFAGIVTLSLLLEPAEFALYGFVTTAMLVAAAVGDLGLGARIIREGEPTDSRLAGSLALQLAFWVPFCVAGAAAGVAVEAYGFSATTIVLLFACLLLLSLQALPTAVLERRLSFGRIAIIEVAQRLVFVGGAVALAAASPSEAAIPIAAAAAAVVGYPATLIASRWRWRPRLAGGERLFRGFSSDWWQSRIANQLSYAAYPLLGGILFTASEVGLLVWALAITSAPALVSPMVARALFPALARADAEEQVVTYRWFLKGVLVVGLPLVAVIFSLAEPLTLEIFGEKWRDGIGLLRLESVTTALGLAVTTSVPLVFLALPSRFVKRTMVAGAGAIWALSVAIAPIADYLAISIATIAVSSVTLLVFDTGVARARGYRQLADLLPGFAATAIAIGVGLVLVGAVDGALGLLAASLAVAGTQVGLTFALGAGVDPRALLRASREARAGAAGPVAPRELEPTP